MGYNTKFDFKIVENKSVLEDDYIIYKLRKENVSATYAFDDDGCSQDSTKWYEYTYDLKEFSKKYPDTVMCLSGDGEENGDVWEEYYKNGKVQRLEAIITMPELNENNWKSDGETITDC